METRNITIMLTDIKGFTSKTASFSRAQTQELLAKHRELVLPVIEKFGGRLVKTIGDAFLAAFNSPTDAVICGVEVQAVLRAHNEGKPAAEKIEIRIAINSGEVAIHDDGDIYGDAVNITSRLESIAEAGEVFFTESVYLSMNKKEVPSSEIGYRQFKGIPEKIKVFRVLRETPVGSQPPGEAGAGAPEAAPPAGAKAAPLDAGRDVPAGFWRRFGSLLADGAIILIIMSSFGLQSCGGAKVRVTDEYGPKKLSADRVSLSDGGRTVQGDNGEAVSIGREGVAITGGAKAGPLARRAAKRIRRMESGVRPGPDEEGKKHLPFKMLLWVLYGAVMFWRFGGTAGMRIFKLKAVDFATGGPLTPDKAFMRAFFSLVSLFGLLGYIWAIWERDRRTWHDIIAGTRIVRT